MPWNAEVEQEYDAMIAGPMGQSLDLTGDWISVELYRTILKNYIRELETGSSTNVNLNPGHSTYLTYYEMRFLHLMRAACNFYMERLAILPWSLREKSVDELRPLLSLNYQGIRLYEGKWIFEGVWDIRPGDHLAEALLYIILIELFVDGFPDTEQDMIVNHIQGMRNAGWAHVTGWWEDYAGYPAHSPGGLGTYNYYDIADLKRGGCHITGNFIIASLRAFNIAIHAGRPWPGGVQPTNTSEYFRWHHKLGHHFLRFACIDTWFNHCDDVYSRLLKTYSPSLAMRSDWWMSANHFDTSDYHWSRASAYEEHFWWCLALGRSDNFWYDVRRLYQSNWLRNRLENIHTEMGLADRDGAPAVVPPVFDDETIDTLIDWVAKKIAEEQNP
jgi:hypothetical protein